MTGRMATDGMKMIITDEIGMTITEGIKLVFTDGIRMTRRWDKIGWHMWYEIRM